MRPIVQSASLAMLLLSTACAVVTRPQDPRLAGPPEGPAPAGKGPTVPAEQIGNPNQLQMVEPVSIATATFNGARGVVFAAIPAGGAQGIYFTNSCDPPVLTSPAALAAQPHSKEQFIALQIDPVDPETTKQGTFTTLVTTEFVGFDIGGYTFYLSDGSLWVNDGEHSHPIHLGAVVNSAEGFTFVEPTALNGNKECPDEEAQLGVFVFGASTGPLVAGVPPPKKPWYVRLKKIQDCYADQ
jgi:hypothetical protein